jgi:hypothetical protein
MRRVIVGGIARGGRVLATIDRWGPMVVAVITLFAVVVFGWHNSERVSRLEGLYQGLDRETESRDRRESMIHDDFESWKAYTITLQKRLAEAGIKVPDAPKR